jgi:hypothetical protein
MNWLTGRAFLRFGLGERSEYREIPSCDGWMRNRKEEPGIEERIALDEPRWVGRKARQQEF